MEKIINRILEGGCGYDNGSLDFSCSKIEITLCPGEIYEGAFSIYAPENCFTSGTILSSDFRMECIAEEFIGAEEEIAFRFHGENMEEGEVVQGSIYIISNQGEYSLPFVVSAEYFTLDSSIGPVRNLFHFANLAKSNWLEAVKLFYSPEFENVLKGADAKFLDDYRALSEYAGSEQNMEEFLIQVNKKQKVEYILPQAELMVEMVDAGGVYSVVEKELEIMRNGWGYTALSVECSGDFLFCEKEYLSDDDFLGNKCVLPIYVDAAACYTGKNFGVLYLYNSYVSMEVPVTVVLGENLGAVNHSLSVKRGEFHLMELYLAFRMKKISTSTWLKETGKLVDKRVSVDENDIGARLLQAQLLITEDRTNEADWILGHVSDLLEKQQDGDTLVAYYLYLNTLIHRETDYVNRVTEKVEYMYRKDNSNWRLAWLLLYLSEEYHRSPAAKWVFLEKQWNAGCISPVIYVEAMILINNNPTLLRYLGGFEQQVIWYGVKNDLIKPDTLEQLIYLASKVREYSKLLYRILTTLYKKRSDSRLLQQICTLLIKGGKTGEKYLEWYKAGVDSNLRITNLYEYYMMSIDPDVAHEIPKVVLLYFSYRNHLDYERTAYLYDYVSQNRHRLGDMYDTYRPSIEQFCLEQVKRMHMNLHLANLYIDTIQPEMIDAQTAGPLSFLLYAYMLRTKDSRLKKVYVYHPGSSYPQEYSLTDGKAWVALYGNEYTIVFEDSWGNRFIKNAEYDIEKLPTSRGLQKALTAHSTENQVYQMYLYRCRGEGPLQNEEEAGLALSLWKSGYGDIQVQRRLFIRLLQFFHETGRQEEWEELLKSLEAYRFSCKERSEIFHYLILEGRADIGKQWVTQYGPYFADAKQLMRLLDIWLEQNGEEYRKSLLAAAEYCFRNGKYDSAILHYLVLFFEGPAKALRDIWKAAVSYGLDIRILSERILAQILYTKAFVGEKMEIFENYVSGSHRPEIEIAFLTQCAADYFVREKVMDKTVFEHIRRIAEAGGQLEPVCQMAYLKYYAENKEDADEGAMALADIFLQEFLNQGIHLDFFREYRNNIRVFQTMEDKTIIEYHASPGARAHIHYVIVKENGESGEYVKEEMREIYGGVCFKEFVLFFGEGLQYYITEQKDGEQQLTESATIQLSDIRSYGIESRYHMINDIVISKTLQDYDTMDNLTEEFYRKEYLNSRLFKLM